MITLAETDDDGDGVLDSDDLCPDTPASDLEAGVPNVTLGVDRWADVDGDRLFETVEGEQKQRKAQLGISLAIVGGCSCSQIIDHFGAGAGHRRFGCSLGLVRQALEWAEAQ